MVEKEGVRGAAGGGGAVARLAPLGRKPATADVLTLAGCRSLNFHKNADNEYCCPVLNKVQPGGRHGVAVLPST